MPVPADGDPLDAWAGVRHTLGVELLVVGARSTFDLTALCARFAFDKLYVFGAAIDAARRVAQGPDENARRQYLDAVERHLVDKKEGAPPPLPAVPAYVEQTIPVGKAATGVDGPAQAVEFWGSRLVMFAPSAEALPAEDADLLNAEIWVVGGGPPTLDDQRGRPVLCPGFVDDDGRLLRLTLARQGARAALVNKDGSVHAERTIPRRKRRAQMVVR